VFEPRAHLSVFLQTAFIFVQIWQWRQLRRVFVLSYSGPSKSDLHTCLNLFMTLQNRAAPVSCAFAELRKANISFMMCVCVCVCVCGTTRLPQDGLPLCNAHAVASCNASSYVVTQTYIGTFTKLNTLTDSFRNPDESAFCMWVGQKCCSAVGCLGNYLDLRGTRWQRSGEDFMRGALWLVLFTKHSSDQTMKDGRCM
jgi:hypothetical protein